MKSEKTILLKGLTKKFSSYTAVNNLNLEINAGEIVGFLGSNGAGKSTTLKMIASLIKPDLGEIWIRNEGNLERFTEKSRDILLNNVGFLIENPVFYKSCTPKQILSYFAKLKGYNRSKVKSRVKEVVEMVGMTPWINKPIGTFSKGMKQKIGILSALIHDPEIIVLDEPFTGLDPKARKDIRDLILRLKGMGKTIFLSSHLLFEISEIADRVAMISKGSLIAYDTIDNLEALAKKSVINIEMLDKFDEIKGIEKIKHSLENNPVLFKKLNSTAQVSYNHDMKRFELMFDGDPISQYKILDALIKDNVQIINYSVPKADLLEDLYLDFMAESRTSAFNCKLEA